MAQWLNLAKTLELGSFGFVLMAASAPAATYDDVQPIIAANCLSCHSGSDALGEVALDTEKQVVDQATALYQAISTGLMPYGDADFRNTPDGVKLSDWLKTKIPVTPAPQ